MGSQLVVFESKHHREEEEEKVKNPSHSHGGRQNKIDQVNTKSNEEDSHQLKEIVIEDVF